MSKISPVTGHYVDVDVDGLLYKVFYLENGTGQPLGVPAHRRGSQPSVAPAAGRRRDHRELSRHRLRPTSTWKVRSAGEHRVVDRGIQTLG